jgi:hypothetical protein
LAADRWLFVLISRNRGCYCCCCCYCCSWPMKGSWLVSVSEDFKLSYIFLSEKIKKSLKIKMNKFR